MFSGNPFYYYVEADGPCTFEGVKAVQTSEFKPGKRQIAILEQINNLQRKLNLSIDESEIEPERITFSITGATNLTFEFTINKETCVLVKKVRHDKKLITFNAIEMEYSNALLTPVIKKMVIVDGENNKTIDLYPWAMHGQIATYEFLGGPALSIHSNIRKKNLNNFQKNDLVIEPIPAFLFRYGPFFLNKDGLGSLLFHMDDFNLLGMGILEGEPYESYGLREREKGVFLGGIAKYKSIELIYYNDFLYDKGANLKLNFAPEYYPRSDWKLTPHVFVQYWNNDYVDYYFGVTPAESSSGMRPYKGKSTLNFGTMFEAVHYAGRWMFVADAGIKSYGKEVYASPTVTKQHEFRFIASVLYKIF